MLLTKGKYQQHQKAAKKNSSGQLAVFAQGILLQHRKG